MIHRQQTLAQQALACLMAAQQGEPSCDGHLAQRIEQCCRAFRWDVTRHLVQIATGEDLLRGEQQFRTQPPGEVDRLAKLPRHLPMAAGRLEVTLHMRNAGRHRVGVPPKTGISVTLGDPLEHAEGLLELRAVGRLQRVHGKHHRSVDLAGGPAKELGEIERLVGPLPPESKERGRPVGGSPRHQCHQTGLVRAPDRVVQGSFGHGLSDGGPSDPGDLLVVLRRNRDSHLDERSRRIHHHPLLLGQRQRLRALEQATGAQIPGVPVRRHGVRGRRLDGESGLTRQLRDFEGACQSIPRLRDTSEAVECSRKVDESAGALGWCLRVDHRVRQR